MIWVGLIGYFIILLTVGFVTKKNEKKTFEEFSVGSRAISGWVIGMSEATSLASAFLWLAWIGQGYTNGVVTLWYALPVVLTTWIIWSFVAPRFRKRALETGSINIAEMLMNEFDDTKKTLKTVYGAFLAIVTFYFMFMYAGSQFTALGSIFSNLTDGAVTPKGGLLIGAVIVVIYTYLGGYKAVVWTDFIQSIAVTGSLFALTFIVISACGGFGGYLAGIDAVGDGFGSMKGTFSSSGLVLYILAWFSSAFCFFGQPHAAVRWLSVATDQECRKAGMVATMFQFIRMVFPIMIGIGARILYGSSIANPENAIFRITEELTGPLFTGILMAGIIAATMSTADSQFLEAVNTFTKNIYSTLIKKGKTDDENLLKLSKAMVIVVAGLAVAGALLRPDTIFGAVHYAFIALGAAFGPTLIMMLFFRKSMTLEGCLAGGVLGSIGFVIFKNMMDAGVFSEGFLRIVSTRESLVLFPVIIIVTIIMNVIFKDKNKDALIAEGTKEV